MKGQTMGLLEIVLVLILIAAIFGRGPLALGVVFDFFIGLIILGLLYRLIVLVL